MNIEIVILVIIGTAGLAIALIRVYLKSVVQTTVQESIKHGFELHRQQIQQEFEREIKTLEHRDRFRLAALDERLQAHQEAFSLALDMHITLFGEEKIRRGVLSKVDAFWRSKSLYLGNDARREFKSAIDSYYLHEMHNRAYKRNPTDENEKKLEDIFNQILALTDTLAKSVDLDAMGKEVLPISAEEKRTKGSSK